MKSSNIVNEYGKYSKSIRKQSNFVYKWFSSCWRDFYRFAVHHLVELTRLHSETSCVAKPSSTSPNFHPFPILLAVSYSRVRHNNSLILRLAAYASIRWIVDAMDVVVECVLTLAPMCIKEHRKWMTNTISSC